MADVSSIQSFLNTQGFKLVVDGKNGPATKRALMAWQIAHKLRGDGIWGPNTEATAIEYGYGPSADEPKATAQTVSDAGKAFIKSFEKEILSVYDDGYGFPTCGVGHKVRPADKLKLGDKITKEQSAAFFAADLAAHTAPIAKYVKVPLTQGQYDALASLIFNLGEPNFAKSSVLRELNAGNYAAASKAFALYNRSNGKISNGLIRRRAAEIKMFGQ